MATVNKTLTSDAVTLTGSAGRGVARTVKSTTSVLRTITKMPKRNLSDTVTTTAPALRRVTKKNLVRVLQVVPTVRKKTTKTTKATSITKPKFVFQFAWKKTMTTTVTSTAKVKKFIETTKKVTVTPMVTFRRFSKRVAHSLTRPTVTFGFRQSLRRTLQDTVTTRARVYRRVSKTLPRSVTIAPALRKTTRKGISATSSVLGSVTRLFIQGTGWIQWNGPDQNPTPLELLGMWDGEQIVPLEWTGEEVN